MSAVGHLHECRHQYRRQKLVKRAGIRHVFRDPRVCSVISLLDQTLVLHCLHPWPTMSAVLPLCRRQPVQYFEFRNVRVRGGSIVFASPPGVTEQPVSSPIEVYPGKASLVIKYQTAAVEGASPLAKCVCWCNPRCAGGGSNCSR